MKYLTTEELEAGLENIRQSPKDNGVLELIVRRPRADEREVLDEGELDLLEELVGDNWRIRGSSRTSDGSAHPDMRLNLMNVRVIALVAQARERWSLAGDQLYLDLDLSADNLPAGTRRWAKNCSPCRRKTNKCIPSLSAPAESIWRPSPWTAQRAFIFCACKTWLWRRHA
jgi:hypothetical protein